MKSRTENNCKYLKYNHNGAVVVCRTATKDLTNDEICSACPNKDNPYVITPICWNIDT